MIIEEKKSHHYDCPTKLDRNCLGSACMAWRWHSVPNPDYRPAHPLDFAGQNPATMISPWMLSKTHGYCGMAGSL